MDFVFVELPSDRYSASVPVISYIISYNLNHVITACNCNVTCNFFATKQQLLKIDYRVIFHIAVTLANNQSCLLN